MDREFWDARWDQNKIAFHEDRPNTLLSEQFDNLSLRAESTVFVPLCGMAIDLDWLNSRGHHVVGIEFNRRAVEDVFKRRKIKPDVQQLDACAHYKADGIDLFVGDFFDLTSELVGPVDVVYDRAALVALPASTRPKYADHLTELTDCARQLLISYDYDQTQTDGPPFSVPIDEIETLYGQSHRISPLARQEISGPLSKRCSGWENVFLLEARS